MTLAFLCCASLAFAGRQWIKYDGTIGTEPPALQIKTNSVDGFDFRLHIPAYRIDDLEAGGEIWQQIDFEGAAMHSTPGEPQLPVYTRWIAVPQGATPEIKVTAGARQTLKNIRQLPAQIPPTDCAVEADPAFA
jgi:hypothetical protein